jgi:S1-C subfamily serine protease
MAPAALTTVTIMALLGATDPAAGLPSEGRPESAPSLASLEEEQANLFARVAPSVVLLVRDGASGSGFVVGPDGLVLTNAHVVGEADEVTVQLSDGRHGLGRVLARATGALDVALVQIPFHDVPPLPAGEPAALRAGAYAATVGHGGGAAWTFSTGLVANPRPLGDGAPMLLAQMALRPGSSGGPLVDRLGRAVGIVTAGTRDASGVTFAIRIDAAAAAFPRLAPWIAAAGHSPSTLAVAPPPT